MRRKGKKVFRSVFIKYLLRTGNSLISGQPHKNIKYALKRENVFRSVFIKVIRSGFEPETHSLEGCCSIQLSYRTLRSGCKGTKYF